MSAPVISEPAVISGPCVGGCGRVLSREPAVGIFAELANGLALQCEACAAEQQLRFERQELERDAWQTRIERRRREHCSGLPRELRALDLGALDPFGRAAALTAARQWAGRELRGVMLTGSPGTGKSTIAAAALRLLLRTSPGRWVCAPDLLGRLGAGFGSQQREWALDLLTARHALVLDDIDKARPTEFAAEQLYTAVDNAMTRGQQLLVTTNLSPGELAERWPAPFGDAIASRLAGYCTGFVVTGRDRRLGGAGV